MSTPGHTRRMRSATWNQPRFRSLSDDAKLLYLYLLLGPETSPIPGVVVVGREALAELCGWSSKRLGAAFAELERARMARADWEERLVWFPEALRHRPPDNRNQVVGWRDYWVAVPECPLRSAIYAELEAVVVPLGPSFEEALRKAIPYRSPVETVSPKTENGTGNGRAPRDETVAETGVGSGMGEGSGEGGGSPPSRTRPDGPSNLLHCLRVAMEEAHPELGMWQGGDLRQHIARQFYDEVAEADLPRFTALVEERIRAFVEDPRGAKAGWSVKAFVTTFDALGKGGGRDPRVGSAVPDDGHVIGPVDLTR